MKQQQKKLCPAELCALLLLFVFALAACHTVMPPTRPVAYLVPSLRSMADLEELRPQDISPAELAALLATMGCESLLRAAGMPDYELSTIARGLAQRGYAELDARRSAGPILWIAFAGQRDGRLQIIAAFRQYPPKTCRGEIDLNRPAVRQIRSYDPYGRRQITQIWSANNVEMRRQRWPATKNDDLWEMHWMFTR
jgi:hypothetical protein